MNLISYEFFLFLALAILLYYICPKRCRYLVLLGASVFFYLQTGWKEGLFILSAWVITYLSAFCIAKVYQKNKNNKSGAKVLFWTGFLLLFAMLFYTKAGKEIVQAFRQMVQGREITWDVIIPLGISYYTFAALGYLADVYWKKVNAENNPLKLLLYLCYFPHILQGPIPKYKKLADQLTQAHTFDFERLCFGLQRALWGYFKKMVLADRLAMMTGEVFKNYLAYEGLVFVFGLVGAVLQLYCDFSGCMDIALGISEIFGIYLDENFRRPFYSRSAAEFWRRWHISLGAWFKDYVYMPVSVSPLLIKTGKVLRDHVGKRAAKVYMTAIPLLTVWILTGLWHGTGVDYLVWGCYWGIIIFLSSAFDPEIRKIRVWAGIRQDSVWWQNVQRIRTFVLYMVGRLLTIPGNLATSRWIGHRILTYNPWVIVDGTFLHLGWEPADVWIVCFGLLILWIVSRQQEKGECIRKRIATFPLPARWALYIGAVLAVVVFGVYGSGISAGKFAYMNY